MTALRRTANPDTASQRPRSNSIASELYKLVLCKQWDQVTTRVTSHPHEARYMDDFGLCPLHRACFRDAPLCVISSLVAAYPEATSIQDQCDFSGLTPLHAACHYCSSQVVRVLLHSDAAVVYKRNTKGQTPLECTCQVYEARVRHHFDRIEKHNATRGPGAPVKPWTDIFDDDPILLRFWRVACLLLKAQVHGCVADPHSNGLSSEIVHACASAAAYIPMVLLELAVKLHPEQLAQFNTDKDLPLHIALMASISKEQQVHSDVVIQYLLQAHPQAAAVPSAQGVFPLVLARQGGKSWKALLHPLLQAHPAALYAMELHDASYANIFHTVGACGRREKRGGVNVQEDAVAVSTLFGLLREYPTLMDLAQCETQQTQDGETEKFASQKSLTKRSRIGVLLFLPVSFAVTVCRLRGSMSKRSPESLGPQSACRNQVDGEEHENVSEPGRQRSIVKLWT